MLPVMGSIFVACTRSRKINELGRKSWEWSQWLELLAYVDLMDCKKSSIPKCFVRGWFRCSQRLMVCLVN